MNGLASPEQIIEAARGGNMVILVDDEHRENEGDLVIPAEAATPDVINFMATHGRGLICLALTPGRVRELELPPMAQTNDARHQTAFTTSIEAREGVTTGISAADRAHTIQVAISPESRRQDLSTPGHVFPLVAREGGVLSRAGHTEAAVDLARLAGKNPAGVICEIMDPDGTMARLSSLLRFAKEHDLLVGTIADLIEYRRRKDTLLECVRQQEFTSDEGGLWTARLYANKSEGTEHLALVKGDIDPVAPTLVRMHNLSFLDDALARTGDRGGLLTASMREIAKEGRGALVIIRHTQSGQFTELLDSKHGAGPADSGLLRDYGVGAHMLLDIGVRDMILLTNSSDLKLAGLEGYALRVVGHRPIPLKESSRLEAIE